MSHCILQFQNYWVLFVCLFNVFFLFVELIFSFLYFFFISLNFLCVFCYSNLNIFRIIILNSSLCIFSSLGEKTLKKNMAERLRTRTPHSQNVVLFFSLYHLGNLSFPVFKMGIKTAFIAQLAREHQDGAVTA